MLIAEDFWFSFRSEVISDALTSLHGAWKIFSLNRITIKQFEHAAIFGTTSYQKHGLSNDILETDKGFLRRNGVLPITFLNVVEWHGVLIISTELLDSSDERNNSSLYRSHLCHFTGPEYKKPAMSKHPRSS